MNHGGTCIFQLFYLTVQVRMEIAVLSIHCMDDQIFDRKCVQYVRIFED